MHFELSSQPTPLVSTKGRLFAMVARTWAAVGVCAGCVAGAAEAAAIAVTEIMNASMKFSFGSKVGNILILPTKRIHVCSHIHPQPISNLDCRVRWGQCISICE